MPSQQESCLANWEYFWYLLCSDSWPSLLSGEGVLAAVAAGGRVGPPAPIPPIFSLVKCILLRWCRYAPLEMKGVSQKGHLMAESLPTAWLQAQEKARMAPGSDIGLALDSLTLLLAVELLPPAVDRGVFFWSSQTS